MVVTPALVGMARKPSTVDPLLPLLATEEVALRQVPSKSMTLSFLAIRPKMDSTPKTDKLAFF
jgi:hypothetical protein